jgi:hypothetical protein
VVDRRDDYIRPRGYYDNKGNLLNVGFDVINGLPAEVAAKVSQTGFDEHVGTDVTDTDGVHGLEIVTGTWTPEYTPATGAFTEITYHVSRRAYYYKIGNLCFIQGFIRTMSLDVGTASGNLSITGLPFAETQFSVIGVIANTSWTTAPVVLLATSSKLDVYRTLATQAQVTDMATGENKNSLSFSGVYRTA